MKRFVLAIALACALSGTALAGEVHTTGAPVPGDMHSTGAPSPQASSSVVATVILTIISLVVR